jgi:predicted GH43/DUF377 family glycosyl hydrolase
MIAVRKEGVILQKTELEFENEGVLNPAVIVEGTDIHIFYRAVRKGNFSTIGYCKLNEPLKLVSRNDAPIIDIVYDYESHGVEDPRISKIEGTYYLTYTAYDGVNALACLATSKDLKTFEKKGFIVPQFSFDEFKAFAQTNGKLNEKYQRYNEHEKVHVKEGVPVLIWDKNVIFFPRKINGKFAFLHRIKPDIQLVMVENLSDLTPQFWRDYFVNFNNNIVMAPKHRHEISYIGGGCPPIETPEGWLLIYHSVHDTVNGYVYSACAALLDLQNPCIEIARLPYPLFKPELDWELKGEVNNVCFPTGTVLQNDILYIYYGAADERIGCASISFQALITELLLNKI